MRTTITIAEELLKEAQELSGKTGYSEAIVTSFARLRYPSEAARAARRSL